MTIAKTGSESGQPEPTGLNLYQKIARLTGEIEAIEKTGRNEMQKYNFIEQAQVIAELRPKLAQYNIVIVPGIVEHDLIKKEKGSKVIIKCTFTVIDGDKPEDQFERTWYGEGDDTLDKGTNKAATAAEKYFLMKLFKISDKEDADAGSPDTGGYAVTAPAEPQPVTDQQRKTMFALMHKIDLKDPNAMKAALKLNGYPESTKDMDRAQASEIIDKLVNKNFAVPAIKPPVKPDEVITEVDDVDLAKNMKEAESTFLATDEIKQSITDKIDSLDLSSNGRVRFLKETTGRLSLQQCNDEDWMKLEKKVDAVLNGAEELPADWFTEKQTTPKTKESNSEGVKDGSSDTKDQQLEAE